MSVKFRCKLNNNIFEFVNDFDIKDMREHPDYEEVIETSKETLVKEKAKVTKKEAK